MTRTLPAFTAMLNMMGSDVTYHREEGGVPCPCLTPEGFRDPAWHLANPLAPVCNEEGMLPGVIVNAVVKASVQPATIGLRGRAAERIQQILGSIERDDHFGVFPCEWGGTTLDFTEFVNVESNFVIYDGRRFFVVAADKIPDIDGDPNHHWELGLRLVKNTRPV